MAYSTLGVTYRCNKLAWGPLPDGLFPSSKPKAQTAQHYGAVGSVKASAGLCKQEVDSASPLSGFVGHWCGACLSPLLCLGHREQTGACLLRAWPSSPQNPQESLHPLLWVLDQALRHLITLYSCNSPHPPTLPFSLYSAWRQCARRCAILPVDCWFKLPSPSSVL